MGVHFKQRRLPSLRTQPDLRMLDGWKYFCITRRARGGPSTRLARVCSCVGICAEGHVGRGVAAHSVVISPPVMPHRACRARLAPVLRCVARRFALFRSAAMSTYALVARPLRKMLLRFAAGVLALLGRPYSPHVFFAVARGVAG